MFLPFEITIKRLSSNNLLSSRYETIEQSAKKKEKETNINSVMFS